MGVCFAVKPDLLAGLEGSSSSSELNETMECDLIPLLLPERLPFRARWPEGVLFARATPRA